MLKKYLTDNNSMCKKQFQNIVFLIFLVLTSLTSAQQMLAV